MKMQDSPNFFSDPKVIISILALVVSIVTLIWTLYNQSEQNRRWEKLNNANPELKDVRLINRKEINKNEASATLWGYNPDIYEKGEGVDSYVLPYCLVARDLAGNKIDGVNAVFTVSEIIQELSRIHLVGGDVALSKCFRPKLIFENMGKTEARELSIKVDARLPSGVWRDAFTSNAAINLAGGQSTTVHFDFELPIDLPLPPQVSFKVLLKFKDVNNNSIEKNIAVKWTTSDNFWSYEELLAE